MSENIKEFQKVSGRERQTDKETDREIQGERKTNLKQKKK